VALWDNGLRRPAATNLEYVLHSGDAAERLWQWIPPTGQITEREHFSRNNVRAITMTLEAIADGSWSRIPRT
jgi:hypothetical protein